MSQEITVSYGLAVRKGSLSHTVPQASLKVDMTGNRMISNVQNIPSASGSGLNMAGAAWTPGYAIFVNLSTTSGEYIDVGVKPSSTFYPISRIYPSQISIMPLQTLSIFAQAGSGTPALDFTVIEY